MSAQDSTHREALRRPDKMPFVCYNEQDFSYSLLFDAKGRDKSVSVSYQRCRAIIDSYCEGTSAERSQEVESIISDSEIDAAR